MTKFKKQNNKLDFYNLFVLNQGEIYSEKNLITKIFNLLNLQTKLKMYDVFN